MTESGYALVVAGGDAALAILTRPGQAAADCVVLDLVMSGLDGLGALVEEPNAPRALLPLLADHGQVRPLDEIKGEVIRFAPAHSGRRLFKAARRRVMMLRAWPSGDRHPEKRRRGGRTPSKD